MCARSVAPADFAAVPARPPRPRIARLCGEDCGRGLSEIPLGMSDGEDTNNLEPQEQGHDQDALDEQEGKGYGEDEGERDRALESE